MYVFQFYDRYGKRVNCPYIYDKYSRFNNIEPQQTQCAFGACVDSEGPDQTARMRSLIWAFAVH